jgi:hypothetical protein
VSHVESPTTYEVNENVVCEHDARDARFIIHVASLSSFACGSLKALLDLYCDCRTRLSLTSYKESCVRIGVASLLGILLLSASSFIDQSVGYYYLLSFARMLFCSSLFSSVLSSCKVRKILNPRLSCSLLYHWIRTQLLLSTHHVRDSRLVSLSLSASQWDFLLPWPSPSTMVASTLFHSP